MGIRMDHSMAPSTAGPVADRIAIWPMEVGDGWTLRFGPLAAAEVGVALGAFVR